MPILFNHLRPVDSDGPGEDVGVQLCVFYVAKMLGKSLGRQSLRFALTAFVPPDPPTLDILSSVDPNLSHNIESIVISGARIKRKKGPGQTKDGNILETCAEVFDLSEL